MYHLSSGAVGAIVVAAAAGALAANLTGMPSPAADAVVAGSERSFTPTPVVRTLKSGRAPSSAEAADAERAIASVEVIGIRNVAVIYRDRQGQVLFRTDPVANMTVVTKGVALPEVTIRDTQSAPTAPYPPASETPSTPKETMPVGCESAFSAIADRALARIPSRCLSRIDDGWRFAAIMR